MTRGQLRKHIQDNAKFYINSIDGVVVAKLKEVPEEFQQFVNRIFSYIFYHGVIEELKNATGIARCNFSEGDVFDEEFGINLAIEKLIKKYYSVANAAISEAVRSCHREIDYINKNCGDLAFKENFKQEVLIEDMIEYHFESLKTANE